MEFLLANKLVILAFALALSELLALIPSVKSNSIFQLISNGIKKLKGE